MYGEVANSRSERLSFKVAPSLKLYILKGPLINPPAHTATEATAGSPSEQGLGKGDQIQKQANDAFL